MRYEEFRAAWDSTLRESKLGMIGLRGEETLNTRTMDRVYEVHVEPFGGQDAEPFFVTATLSFRWDALNTARTAAREEDMLTELFGRESAYELETERPWLRIDIQLKASLPWGKPLLMPSKAAWSMWIHETMGRLETVEPLTPDEKVRENEEGSLEVLAWQGAPEARVSCTAEGDLLLESVSISAMQTMRTPRIFDDPDKEPDEPVYGQLLEMFHRVRASLLAWMQALDHLKRKSPRN